MNDDVPHQIGEKFGVTFSQSYPENKLEAMSICEKELKEKKSAIITLDVFYLEYSPFLSGCMGRQTF
jgi:hypothetical protein